MDFPKSVGTLCMQPFQSFSIYKGIIHFLYLGNYVSDSKIPYTIKFLFSSISGTFSYKYFVPKCVINILKKRVEKSFQSPVRVLILVIHTHFGSPTTGQDIY